jgi:hypothetical protein
LLYRHPQRAVPSKWISEEEWSKVRAFPIQRQNVRESGLRFLQELKLCGLFFGGYPTIAKSLKGIFEPQNKYF